MTHLTSSFPSPKNPTKRLKAAPKNRKAAAKRRGGSTEATECPDDHTGRPGAVDASGHRSWLQGAGNCGEELMLTLEVRFMGHQGNKFLESWFEAKHADRSNKGL